MAAAERHPPAIVVAMRDEVDAAVRADRIRAERPGEAAIVARESDLAADAPRRGVLRQPSARDRSVSLVVDRSRSHLQRAVC